MLHKKITPILVATCLLTAPLVAVAASGLGPVAPFAGTSSGTLIDAITNIVNALLAFAAVLAVIFVIVGGVRYIIAQGDDDAAAGAKSTVLYAVVGIIIIALSAVIINFILNNL